MEVQHYTFPYTEGYLPVWMNVPLGLDDCRILFWMTLHINYGPPLSHQNQCLTYDTKCISTKNTSYGGGLRVSGKVQTRLLGRRNRRILCVRFGSRVRSKLASGLGEALVADMAYIKFVCDFI